MIHPIFSVLINRPELVVYHVAGYASLMREEASSVGSQLAQRAIAWGLVAVGSFVFLILLGVAIMLGAMHERFDWALVIVPAVPSRTSRTASPESIARYASHLPSGESRALRAARFNTRGGPPSAGIS